MNSSGAPVARWPWTGERITCAAAEIGKTMRTYRKSAYRANKIEMSLIFNKKIKLIFFYILRNRPKQKLILADKKTSTYPVRVQLYRYSDIVLRQEVKNAFFIYNVGA